MQEDFLGKLFKILQIPETVEKHLREELKVILIANVGAALLADLPAEKKNSFVALIKDGTVEQESIEKWVKDNHLDQDREFLKKLTL